MAPFPLATDTRPASIAAAMSDADWLAHRYDPEHDAVHFLRVPRAEHRKAVFLTDEYLPRGLQPLVVQQKAEWNRKCNGEEGGEEGGADGGAAAMASLRRTTRGWSPRGKYSSVRKTALRCSARGTRRKWTASCSGS